jgi:hypothetical protein
MALLMLQEEGKTAIEPGVEAKILIFVGNVLGWFGRGTK